MVTTALIARHVEENVRYPGPARARLASAYGLSLDALEAVLAHYGHHKAPIDAQIALNPA